MLDKFLDFVRLGTEEENEEIEYDDVDDRQEKTRNFSVHQNNKDMRKDMNQRKSGDCSQVVIARPKTIEDAKTIIDNLMAGSFVTIDFTTTEDREKQRIIDMVSGYCYGFGFNIEQVNINVFVVSRMDIQVD